jgi:hypothetical protein
MIDELDVPVRSKFWLYTFILLFITVNLNGLLSEHLTVSGADPQKLTHYGKRYLVVGGPKWHQAAITRLKLNDSFR